MASVDARSKTSQGKQLSIFDGVSSSLIKMPSSSMNLKNLTFDAREILQNHYSIFLQTHYSIFLQTHYFVSCLSID